MKASLYSTEGKKKKEVILTPEIYGARVNARLIELAEKAYAANKRRGTASTKVRKEVRGGGKKPWRQKGTGNARAGSSRSPIWRGGGVVFGPHPRDYSVHLPKKMRLKALVSALSLRASKKGLMLLEETKIETAKTKEWVDIVKALPLQGKRALYVVSDVSENLKRASKNLRNLVTIKTASDFSAFDILQRERLIIDEKALELIEKRLIGEKAHEAQSV